MTQQLAFPPSNGTRTSRAAAEAIEPLAARQRRHVFRDLIWWTKYHQGATREQLAETTGLSGDSLRPRVWELIKQGYAEPTGQTRRTRSGREAEVLRAVTREGEA